MTNSLTRHCPSVPLPLLEQHALLLQTKCQALSKSKSESAPSPAWLSLGINITSPPVSHLMQERWLRFSGHVQTLNRITIRSLGRRSYRPVIGDLVDALVPAGWGRLILMYSHPTSGSTQPGERPVTTRSDDVSLTWQHSLSYSTRPLKKSKAMVAAVEVLSSNLPIKLGDK